MELHVSERKGARKSEAKRLRREGMIPAIVYGLDGEPQKVTLSDAEFAAALRKIAPGCLPTTTFTLKGEQGSQQAVVKDIQYKPTSYEVTHLDFQLVKEGAEVTVKVPIHAVGQADCIGMKLGGVLRQVVRFLPVRCLPADIPAELAVDVRELKLGQTRRLRDIPLPPRVRPLAKMDEVAVVIARR